MIAHSMLKLTRRSLIASAASAGLISLSSCAETTKQDGAESSSISAPINSAAAKPSVTSEPLFRAAGEGVDYEWGKDHIFVKLSSAETGGALTLIQDNLKPGFDLGIHLHHGHTEIFYILDGEVEFETDTASFTAKMGSVVYLPAGIPHAAKSSTGGRMLMFYAPGGFDEMLAEIENSSWFQRVSPFARARRDEKYDFIKVTKDLKIAANTPKPVFLEGGGGREVSLVTGSSTMKLSSAETDGLATMVEETLKPGAERISSLPGNQVEILYVLEGEIEVKINNAMQVASTGATLYFPTGVDAEVVSPSGARILAYRTPGID